MTGLVLRAGDVVLLTTAASVQFLKTRLPAPIRRHGPVGVA